MPLADRRYMKEKHESILRNQRRADTLNSALVLLAVAMFTFLVWRLVH